jgi:hypothetical protein
MHHDPVSLRLPNEVERVTCGTKIHLAKGRDALRLAWWVTTREARVADQGACLTK